MHGPQRSLTPEEVGAYLARIGLPPVVPAPDLTTLQAIHDAHARTVPFENLDIVAGVAIRLDVDHLLDKVVVRRRGGFCYELNGLVHALLVTLGFDAWLVEARSGAEAALGPRFDHARVLVALDGRRWLVDLGNGASPLVPMDLDHHDAVDTGPSVLRVVPDGEGWRTDSRDPEGGWVRGWWFDATPQPLTAFADRCRYQESDPGSHFTQGLICSRPTPRGKISLTADRLITTVDGRRTEEPVTDVSTALLDVFGIRWPDR